MRREYYSDSIEAFLTANRDEILGKLTRASDFDLGQTQRDAWMEEICILQDVLKDRAGSIYFEFSIPRMGRRIDVVLLIGPVLFVIEFKAGEKEFKAAAKDQVWDYALDLKNFHESSHALAVVPILVATNAKAATLSISVTHHNDKLLAPIECSVDSIKKAIDDVLHSFGGPVIEKMQWEAGRYCPTPTIIEAAMALYSGHSVSDISRSDAGAINLGQTSIAISEIVQQSKDASHKAICFITGVPGAGKTLVKGLSLIGLAWPGMLI